MKEFLLDLLFPKRCVFCKKFGLYLCPNCQKKIVYLSENVCPVCERASTFGTTHPVCQNRYSLDGLFSACLYGGVIKKVIHQYKYQPYLSNLSELLIKMVILSIKINQDNLITQFIKNNRPVIVPIPLYKSRQNERGFNQAGLIAKLLAKEFNLTFCPDLLERIKPTKPQAKLNVSERQLNIKNAFKINPIISPSFISSYHHILLVDDIWTTGITLKTCGNLLKRTGFNQVWVLTLAR